MVKEDKFKLIYAQFFPRGADTSGYARFVFNSFDHQRKQEITFTDFVIGLSVLTRGSVEEQLRWIFTLYDTGGDGIITRDELNRVVNSIHDLMGKFALNSSQAAALDNANRGTGGAVGQSNNTAAANNNQPTALQQNQSQQPSSGINPFYRGSEEQAENLFKKFDLNNDGIITLDEFLEACYRVSFHVYNQILNAFKRVESEYKSILTNYYCLTTYASHNRMIILSSQYPCSTRSFDTGNQTC